MATSNNFGVLWGSIVWTTNIYAALQKHRGFCNDHKLFVGKIREPWCIGLRWCKCNHANLWREHAWTT